MIKSAFIFKIHLRNLSTNDGDKSMKINRINPVIFIVICLFSNFSLSQNYADVLYKNATIWTGNVSQPSAEAIALKDKKILAVGNFNTLKNLRGPKTKVIDLNNHFLMPGFIDNHVHFFEGGAALASVDLRNANSKHDFSTRIKNYAQKSAKGKWILNGNWDHENWGGTLPNKSWIDQDTQNNPVFVIRLDGHMALANSAALKLAGITKQTKPPKGGQIILDNNGELTGILKGNALNLILSIIPPPSEQEVLTSFQLAQSHALSVGLTKVFAMTANETETTMLSDFQLAKAKGIMKIRAYVYTPIEHWRNLENLVKTQGKGDELLSWGGVKGFVDGSLGASTAWFYQPYTNNPNTQGAPLTEPAKLTTLINSANTAGLRIAIHAIGDQAIDKLISNYELLAGNDITDLRLRIEHFQHPNQAAINRISQHKIIASAQPYHAVDDGRWAEESIGNKRIKTTYAFKSILDSKAILSFGSDWPVAPLSPLAGIYAAVTRRTTDNANPDGWLPEQKITVEQALKAYTFANAYAGFEEDIVGTLEKGKRADMVVLSHDPRAVLPEELLNIKVLNTIIAGEVVYTADK